MRDQNLNERPGEAPKPGEALPLSAVGHRTAVWATRASAKSSSFAPRWGACVTEHARSLCGDVGCGLLLEMDSGRAVAWLHS